MPEMLIQLTEPINPPPENDRPLSGQFSWLRYVHQYNQIHGQGTVSSMPNYALGAFIAIAAYLEAAFSNKLYSNCFRSYWKETPPAIPVIPQAEARPELPTAEPQKNKPILLTKKKIALAVFGTAALGFLLWKSGVLEKYKPVEIQFSSPINPLNQMPSCPHSDPIPLSAAPPLSEQIVLFTSYTTSHPSRLKMSNLVRDNQLAYAKRRGYHFKAFERNLATDSLPYWSKIKGIIDLLEEAKKMGQTCWIVWLDDDAVILDGNQRMEDWIKKLLEIHPEAHIFVTSDVPHASTKLNTGVLIVRNSDKSLDFFKTLYDMRHQTIIKNDQLTTYSSCPAQSCLHEQEAMHDLLALGSAPQSTKYPFVKIIPQRDPKMNDIGINAFERFDHYDIDRNMQLKYERDPTSSRCQSGDFICQCTGLATNGYKSYRSYLSPSNLRMECIESLLSQAK